MARRPPQHVDDRTWETARPRHRPLYLCQPAGVGQLAGRQQVSSLLERRPPGQLAHVVSTDDQPTGRAVYLAEARGVRHHALKASHDLSSYGHDTLLF